MYVLPEPKLEPDEIGCFFETEKKQKIKIGCRNYVSLSIESNRFCFVLSDVKKVIL